MELYENQRAAVEKLKNGNVLWGGVGTGKSRVAVAYYQKREKPRDVYVITTAKKRESLDWEGEFARIGVGKKPDGTVAGVLHVDSWNNIANYTGIKNAFFIFDEQRVVGKGLWSKAFIDIAKRNRWIMLSATPGDTWLDYVPVFIANGFYKSRSEFNREHVVFKPYVRYPKVERYQNVRTLILHRNSLLVHMPYERRTRRHIRDVLVEHDQLAFKRAVKDRWHVYENRPLTNVSELFSVMRRIASTHPSRLRILRELVATHAKIIIFYNYNYELAMLREFLEDEWISPTENPRLENAETGSGSGKNTRTVGEHGSTSETSHTQESFAVAEWNGSKHQPIPQTDRWVYLVQYTAGAEGWNCIDTNTVIFFSPPWSYKLYEQAMGRIDRLNTPFTDLYYFRFVTNSLIDKLVLRALAEKRNFNLRNLPKIAKSLRTFFEPKNEKG